MGFKRTLELDWKRRSAITGNAAAFSYLMCLHPKFFQNFLIRIVTHEGCSRPLKALCALFLFFMYKIEVNPKLRIGVGLYLPHPHGIVLGAIFIGENVTIFQNVTLGAKSLDFTDGQDTRPKLHDNTTIGAGAVVLGSIQLGSGSTVGANSLLLNSVGKNTTVLGVPAKPKR